MEKMKMTDKVLPMPCNGELYASWTEIDYLLKIGEEYGEVCEAARKLRLCHDTKEAAELYIKLMAECQDLITAVTSYQEKMQFDEKMRQQMTRSINHRNKVRNDGKRIKKIIIKSNSGNKKPP